MNLPEVRPKSQCRPYRFLPFFFRRLNNQVLLVNQGGDYLVLGEEEFRRFVQYELGSHEELYRDLTAKLFLWDKDVTLAIQMLATRYRTKKSFLRAFTALHMLVLTARCNQRCRYCQVACERASVSHLDMQPATARRAVDLIFKSRSPYVKIEFQGGEPLLNFPTLQTVVEYANELNERYEKHLEFVVCTNLTLADHEHLEFFKTHNICVSTSVDGPADIHNACRIMEDGDGSYHRTIAGVKRAVESLGPDGVSALMTASRTSLGRFTEVVDEYLALGFRSIFFRALSPYGRAVHRNRELGYRSEEFVESYKAGLDYILELNRRGIIFMEEYATILLTRMLTPFGTGFVDLQSPTGAGIGCAVYDYDGRVYVSDEGRMLARGGDRTFCMGSVDDDYYSLFGGEVIRRTIEASCVECLPQCSSCAFQLWCGADPVRNYATKRDFVVHKPTDDFCMKNTAIFDYLLEKASSSEPFVQDIIWSWITRRPAEGITSLGGECP